MVKAGKKTQNPVWLKLPGYRVVASKPEFDEHAVELGWAIQRGIPAYPDLARGDFYDLALEEGWAYIHVYRDGHAVYLIAYFPSTFNSLLVDPSSAAPGRERFERKINDC